MRKLLMVVFAVLLAVSLVGIAIAANDLGTYRGEVIALDHYAKTVTVRGSEPAVSPFWLGGEQGISAPLGSLGAFKFSTDKETSVLMCNMSRDFSSISVGDRVNIKYGEKNGDYIAKFVDIRVPTLACNLE